MILFFSKEATKVRSPFLVEKTLSIPALFFLALFCERRVFFSKKFVASFEKKTLREKPKSVLLVLVFFCVFLLKKELLLLRKCFVGSCFFLCFFSKKNTLVASHEKHFGKQQHKHFGCSFL